jgi:hypothetical protein
VLPSWRKNQASWELNQEARRALGPKFAGWIVQCIVEIIPDGHRAAWCGGQGNRPVWRLILDVRVSNETHDDWGVWYMSVSALAALLDVCDIMFAEDLEDTYHLSAFAGGTGELRWSRVLILGADGGGWFWAVTPPLAWVFAIRL